MRATLALDPDVALKLKARMAEQKFSFKNRSSTKRCGAAWLGAPIAPRGRFG